MFNISANFWTKVTKKILLNLFPNTLVKAITRIVLYFQKSRKRRFMHFSSNNQMFPNLIFSRRKIDFEKFFLIELAFKRQETVLTLRLRGDFFFFSFSLSIYKIPTIFTFKHYYFCKNVTYNNLFYYKI